MRTKKQKLVLGAKILSAVFVLLLILMIVFRDALLQKAIVVITKKLDREYDSSFSIKKAAFEGLTGVQMEDIILVPHQKDTLFRIHNIKASVGFWHLLTGTIQ